KSEVDGHLAYASWHCEWANRMCASRILLARKVKCLSRHYCGMSFFGMMPCSGSFTKPLALHSLHTVCLSSQGSKRALHISQFFMRNSHSHHRLQKCFLCELSYKLL